jgi:Ca-activated chloride channel family protein
MTAIGDALAQAVDRLKEVKVISKVIILLSDGEQTFGTLSPLEGAEIAKTFGIKIYTIGIGSTGEVPVISTNRFGQRQLVPQYLSIDEESLRKIAEITGGLYFNAKNTQTLEKIYAEIDKLEKTTHEGHSYTQYTELFRIPLLVGTILILLNLVLVSTRFRRLP